MYHLKDISEKARQIIIDNGGSFFGNKVELPLGSDIFYHNPVPPATLAVSMPCGCVIYICKGDPYVRSRCIEVDRDEILFVDEKGERRGYLCKKHRYPKGPKYED